MFFYTAAGACEKIYNAGKEKMLLSQDADKEKIIIIHLYIDNLNISVRVIGDSKQVRKGL